MCVYYFLYFSVYLKFSITKSKKEVRVKSIQKFKNKVREFTPMILAERITKDLLQKKNSEIKPRRKW